MTYYKVKPQYDNRCRYRRNNHGKSVPDGILIAHELYTPGEFKGIANCPEWFAAIEIPKSQIYWFFGARFQSQKKGEF